MAHIHQARLITASLEQEPRFQIQRVPRHGGVYTGRSDPDHLTWRLFKPIVKAGVAYFGGKVTGAMAKNIADNVASGITNELAKKATEMVAKEFSAQMLNIHKDVATQVSAEAVAMLERDGELDGNKLLDLATAQMTKRTKASYWKTQAFNKALGTTVKTGASVMSLREDISSQVDSAFSSLARESGQ